MGDLEGHIHVRKSPLYKTAAKLQLFSDIRKYLVHFVQITLQNDIPILSIMFSHFLPFLHPLPFLPRLVALFLAVTK